MNNKISLEVYFALVDEVIIAVVIAVLILIFLKGYGIVGWKLFTSVLSAIVVLGSLLSLAIMKVYSKKPKVGKEAIVGAMGEALSEINGEGFVLVEGEIWKARSLTGERIRKGEKVRVISLEGLTLIVEREISQT